MFHVKMSKIPQFRDAVKRVTHLCQFEGMDDDGNPVYNNDPLPTLKAVGSVKLHGTCASICYNKTDGMWAQSKNKIITPISDNAGFSFFVVKHHDFLTDLMNEVIKFYSIDTEDNTITIFGEWAGKGIQAGVAITQLERKFFIFGIKITPHYPDDFAYWVDSDIFGEFDDDGDVFHIKNFKTFDLDIDFSNPKDVTEEFEKIVDEIEAECPVAKHFGISGIGEGVVFTFYYKNEKSMFKIKGKKHVGGKKVKQRKTNNVDQQLVNDVVYKITHMRLEQMANESYDIINHGKFNYEGIGNYLKAVKNDIIAEDMDIIIESGLTMKNINKTLHSVAKDYIIEKIESQEY